MREDPQTDRGSRDLPRIQISPGCYLTRCSDYPNFIPASFKIDAMGKVIYLDPYHINDTTPADYIFITHTHPDHLSPTDIARIVKKETRIVCPQQAVKSLARYNLQAVKPGDALQLDDLHCEAVPAYNRWFIAHHRRFGFVGYILTINGLRIYHAGDTDFIREMKEFKNIAVAMVPIAMFPLAMTAGQAAAAINVIRPEIAVPMHYPLGKNTAEKFKQLVEPGIRVEIME